MVINLSTTVTDRDCLEDIMRLVGARLRKDLDLQMQCFSSKQKHLGTTYYIRIMQTRTMDGRPFVSPFVNEPGIPKESLVPEKVGPIAYWIIRNLARWRSHWLIRKPRAQA
jgi:hypothetical protein